MPGRVGINWKPFVLKINILGFLFYFMGCFDASYDYKSSEIMVYNHLMFGLCNFN